MWPALTLTALYAATAGAVVYLLIFRPLRTSSSLANVVASVGLMIVLQALAVLKFGTGPRSTPSILPDRPIHLGGLTVPGDRLWMAGVAVALAAALSAIYRWTRFGLVTQALSENEKGAVLLGWSAHWIATANWALATMLAAAAGVLLIPIAALDPGPVHPVRHSGSGVPAGGPDAFIRHRRRRRTRPGHDPVGRDQAAGGVPVAAAVRPARGDPVPGHHCRSDRRGSAPARIRGRCQRGGHRSW